MIWQSYTNLFPKENLKITKATKEFLYDENGTEYIDTFSSWWVSIHGHNHPYLLKSIIQSFENLDHIILSGFLHPAIEKLDFLLHEFLDNQFYSTVYSENGSSAVDIALKLSIQYYKNQGLASKKEILHFSKCYHGDSIGAMSVSGKNFFNQNYESLFFSSKEFISPTENSEHNQNLLKSIQSYFEMNHSKIAAIILEPLIQGANGMLFYEKNFLNELNSLCKEYNILLILDEIFTGFGRTGKKFAFEHLDFIPDLLTVAKGLTGGVLPMAATLVSEKISKEFYSKELQKFFLHGHTWSGNPACASSALASIELFSIENRIQDIQRLENYFLKKKIQFEEKFLDKIENLRTRGTVFAFDLKLKSKEYGSNLSYEFKMKLQKKGILIRPLGATIYITPPYIIQESSLEKIFYEIENSLSLFSPI
jgi:adenosylmethionine-8-amino-7-oxononanoate aminotransferase